MRTEPHFCPGGTERWTSHRPWGVPTKIIVQHGAIRVWTVKDGELEMPPRDVFPMPRGAAVYEWKDGNPPIMEGVCDLPADKPFVIAALKRNTLFVHITP